MTSKQSKVVILIVFTLAILLFLFEKGFLPGISSKSSPYRSLRLLGSVIGLVKNEYIVEVNPERTMNGALKGLIDSLDILSSYLDSKNTKKYRELEYVKFYDPGIILSKNFGSFPVVVGIMEDSPAQKKGIKVGDTLSRLEGISTLNLSLTEAQLFLKSEKKEPLKIRIMRNNETPEYVVERELIYKKPFSFSALPGTNGILSIHHLFPPCVNLIKKQIKPEFLSSRIPLILDFRNCYEGDIHEALKFINLFLKSDRIGYFERHGGEKEVISAPEKPIFEKTPILIWINQATIGPSEAAASVLRELREAKIIGISTPGLAAEREIFPLEDGSALLLTTGIFFPRSGKKIWYKGIEPDEKLEIKESSYSSYVKRTQTILHNM